MYRSKRLLDLVVAIPALIATGPIQLAAAVAVRLTMGGPVLFRQQRPGLDGHPFTIVKLRTMRPIDEATGRIEDAARLTKTGRFLRSTSIDELPTLLNVIRGEMSLVGPRPLLMEYLDLYTPLQARRHTVRPGLTGLAQVRGRNAASWEERLADDIEYVDNHSLRGDLIVLMLTIQQLFRRHGISAHNHATMPRFRGQGDTHEP